MNYTDVLNDGEGFTMDFRISRGRDSQIVPTFIVFKIGARYFRIRTVPEEVEGVAYLQVPKTVWI